MSNILFYDGFENGLDVDTFWRYSGNASVITDKFFKEGTKSLFIYLNKNESIVPYRTELQILSKSLKVEFDKPYYYKFSIYLPLDYKIDVLPESIFQLHHSRESQVLTTFKTPPMALHIEKGKWKLFNRWGTDKEYRSTTRGKFPYQRVIDLGPIELGKWIDFKVNVIWNYLGKGSLEVFKNNISIDKVVGSTCYLDPNPPYFKLGLYKWVWRNAHIQNITERKFYYDEVEIGNAT